MNAKSEKIALFRYGLIATLVLEKLPRGELTRRARELADHDYDIPFSERRRVSVDTLIDWAVRYRTGGLDALAPHARSDRGRSRVITPQVAQLIERLKRENPHRNGTTLLREMALSSEAGTAPLSESSLYRFLKSREGGTADANQIVGLLWRHREEHIEEARSGRARICWHRSAVNL